jgi:hypothetical protein
LAYFGGTFGRYYLPKVFLCAAFRLDGLARSKEELLLVEVLFSAEVALQKKFKGKQKPHASIESVILLRRQARCDILHGELRRLIWTNNGVFGELCFRSEAGGPGGIRPCFGT